MAKADFFWEMGRRIAGLRKARSWSQERLCERSGVASSYIAHIEIGSRKATVLVLLKLADALGVPLWRLLTDDRLTPDETARDAAGRELARSAHGLDAHDLRALSYFANRLQTAARSAAHVRTAAERKIPKQTWPALPHKKSKAR